MEPRIWFLSTNLVVGVGFGLPEPAGSITEKCTSEGQDTSQTFCYMESPDAEVGLDTHSNKEDAQPGR